MALVVSYHCAASAEGLIEVRDVATWNDTWSQCLAGFGQTIDGRTGRAIPPPPAPAIDFSQSIIVGYTWGFLSGGRGLAVEVHHGNGTVIVERITPGYGCFWLAMGPPVGKLLVVPLHDSPTRFDIRDVIGPACT